MTKFTPKYPGAAADLYEALHSANCALEVFLSGELSDASAVERLGFFETPDDRAKPHWSGARP
jgi:hypothetical protein